MCAGVFLSIPANVKRYVKRQMFGVVLTHNPQPTTRQPSFIQNLTVILPANNIQNISLVSNEKTSTL